MKYGRIICDPNEGKELIGKKVVASDYAIASELVPGILVDISSHEDNQYPFKVQKANNKNDKEYYRFVREIIDEAPTYRPFTDDFKTRFILGLFNYKVEYLNNPEGGIFTVTLHKNGKKTSFTMALRDSSVFLGYLAELNSNFSYEPVGCMMELYGYRLLWKGDVVRELIFDLDNEKIENLTLEPKTITDFI